MSPGCLPLVSLCVTVALSLALPVTEDLPQVQAPSGADVTLQCTARSKPGVPYLSLRWYKVVVAPARRLRGLLMQDLPNGTTNWYQGVERQVELVAGSSSIFLPNTTCGDRGVYSCQLAAPVGEQNLEGRVLLNLTDCPESPTERLTETPAEDATEDLPERCSQHLIDFYMLIIATAVLMFALVLFRISYVSLRNVIRNRNKATKTETLLDAPLKPLEKKDLMLIYTLGPKELSTVKHVCV